MRHVVGKQIVVHEKAALKVWPFSSKLKVMNALAFSEAFNIAWFTFKEEFTYLIC